MPTHLFFVLTTVLLAFCNHREAPSTALSTHISSDSTATIIDRFAAPSGFVRTAIDSHSFAYWLRHLPLKPANTPVKLYTGQLKSNQKVHAAVADIETGNKDLQQCADACMRLRAEYLYSQKKYDDIHFNLTNGFRVNFAKWAQGYRVKVTGNTTVWEKKKAPSTSYSVFRDYLQFVFTYAGTLSLSKELPEVPLKNLQIGDIFIKGGSPGHAVMVLDMAKNPKTGAVCFLIGQSYMPAQDFHVLKNLSNTDMSPWYELNNTDELQTPEWTFQPVVVRRFN